MKLEISRFRFVRTGRVVFPIYNVNREQVVYLVAYRGI